MESIALLLFLLQQLGVALGLGSATLALTFSIVGNSDGVFDDSERRFLRIVNLTLFISLFLIIATGIAITAAHILAGDTATVGTPAYLFKWGLVSIATLTAITAISSLLPKIVIGIISGTTWYTLFIVHTAALDVGFTTLLGLFILLGIVFAIGLLLVQRGMRRGSIREVPGTPHAPLPPPSPLAALPHITPVSTPSPIQPAASLSFPLHKSGSVPVSH